MYLNHFRFPSESAEYNYISSEKRTTYDSFYPFKILSNKFLFEVSFAPITIFYGDNGSGKSTALNVIAEHLGAKISSPTAKTHAFDDFVDLCQAEMFSLPQKVEMIKSDDIFQYLLDLRGINTAIDNHRYEIYEDYLTKKKTRFQLSSLDDYDTLKSLNEAKRLTQSKYTRKHLADNIISKSNGETALNFFTEKFDDNGFYMLDEPENSLSPKNQLKLSQMIAEFSRFFGCQFIIATHSPFLLSLKNAKIYDLTKTPVVEKEWKSLENIQIYMDFFKEHIDSTNK